MRREPLRLHLGGDHHLRAQARGAHALADRGFVVVHLRGVDVAIADADRLLDQTRAIAPAQGPGAEANDRNLETLGLDGWRHTDPLPRATACPRPARAAD